MLKSILLASALTLSVSVANADTVAVDISDLAGFTQQAGLIESATYAFAPGTTVDFGKADLVGWSSCSGGNNFCNYQAVPPQVIPWYGTPPTAQQATQVEDTYTGGGGILNCFTQASCANIPMHVMLTLAFTMPADQTMITLLFTAQSLTITPPAVPLPPTILLFGSALLGLIGLRKKMGHNRLAWRPASR
jgi:hypothetical protein